MNAALVCFGVRQAALLDMDTTRRTLHGRTALVRELRKVVPSHVKVVVDRNGSVLVVDARRCEKSCSDDLRLITRPGRRGDAFDAAEGRVLGYPCAWFATGEPTVPRDKDAFSRLDAMILAPGSDTPFQVFLATWKCETSAAATAAAVRAERELVRPACEALKGAEVRMGGLEFRVAGFRFRRSGGGRVATCRT